MKRQPQTSIKQANRLYLGIVSLALVLIAGGLIGWLIGKEQTANIVYVQTQKVYESFSLTQELDAKLSKTFEARKAILENLDLQIQVLKTAQNTSRDSLAFALQNFEQKQAEFSEDQDQQRQAYHQQIWVQLNQYAQEFQQENGFNLVLGADGTGTVMAADPRYDVTDELIQFINQSYEGQ